MKSRFSFNEWFTKWNSEDNKFHSGVEDPLDGSGKACCAKCGETYKFVPNISYKSGERTAGFNGSNALRHYRSCEGKVNLCMSVPPSTATSTVRNISFSMCEDVRELEVPSTMKTCILMKRVSPDSTPSSVQKGDVFRSAMHALWEFGDDIELVLDEDEMLLKCRKCIGERGSNRGQRWTLHCKANTGNLEANVKSHIESNRHKALTKNNNLHKYFNAVNKTINALDVNEFVHTSEARECYGFCTESDTAYALRNNIQPASYASSNCSFFPTWEEHTIFDKKGQSYTFKPLFRSKRCCGRKFVNDAAMMYTFDNFTCPCCTAIGLDRWFLKKVSRRVETDIIWKVPDKDEFIDRITHKKQEIVNKDVGGKVKYKVSDGNSKWTCEEEDISTL